MIHDAISLHSPQDKDLEDRLLVGSDDVVMSDQFPDKFLLFLSIQIHESELVSRVIVIPNERSQCFPLQIMPWMIVGDQDDTQLPTGALDDSRSINRT